ncbi:unnamed protein product [Mycena citricolor]|uniref:Cytochrome P450 n=1 Tax=Mycena citricolor TaxID=2018698 RepID=A0AAD2K6M9_9AGAR|nr:unnamed protein product [Mycena citricolor]CAK5282159.1 unnamed protein product [Mycena citricolor]
MSNFDPSTVAVYGLVAVLPVAGVWLVKTLNQKDPVPAVIGSGGWVDSLKAARYFEEQPMEVVQKGYDEYKDGVFRIPRRWRWDYVVTGPQRIKEVSGAPSEVLSFNDGSGETIQAKYTMGADLLNNAYHALAVRTSLTRNLGKVFPEVRDEIECAIDEVFALQDDEWKLVPVMSSLMKVVARTSNRLFVGLPLCRNDNYLDLNVINTIETVTRGQKLSAWPEFLKPLAAPFIVTRMKRLREMLAFVGPMIEERIAKEDELGPNYEGKPNDLISWLLELAGPDGRHPEPIAARILSLNMAAIHTTSMALAHALFDVTSREGYLEPMREEAENVIRAEGWTKSALNSMHKMDSFIRETQRMQGNGPVTMARKVIHPDGFTFSDGVKVPYGSFVYVSGKPVHYDPKIHEDPEVFKGFRYSDLREAKADNHTVEAGIFNSHMVSTSMEHLSFGHGKHSCPGRFFAATEIKAMLAHILINYDIKAAVPGVRPPNDEHGMMSSPNGTAGILIRKRQL